MRAERLGGKKTYYEEIAKILENDKEVKNFLASEHTIREELDFSEMPTPEVWTVKYKKNYGGLKKMINTILDYEEVKEEVKEESGKIKVGLKKLALMHKNTILQLFDINTDMENIEHKAIEIVENTLQSNIDLCYIVIDKKYHNIIYKNIIQNDIIREELEDYQKINNNIYVLGNKELKNELLTYSKNIFHDILKNSDVTTYNDCISWILTYNDCVGWILEEIENAYNNGYTIFTTNNSFLLHGSYSDVMTTDFEDDYYILSKDTKLFLVDEIENSDLSENIKKEIIENIKNCR